MRPLAFTQVSKFDSQIYILEKNPYYWQPGKPAFQGIRYPAFADNDAANLALANGDLDWAGNFVPDIEKTYVAKDPANFHYYFVGGGVISLVTSRSDAEQRAAETCAVDNLRRPYRWKLGAVSVEDFVRALTAPLGSATARREVEFALRDLSLEAGETRPYMLRRLRDQIETNLSGVFLASRAAVRHMLRRRWGLS